MDTQTYQHRMCTRKAVLIVAGIPFVAVILYLSSLGMGYGIAKWGLHITPSTQSLEMPLPDSFKCYDNSSMFFAACPAIGSLIWVAILVQYGIGVLMGLVINRLNKSCRGDRSGYEHVQAYYV